MVGEEIWRDCTDAGDNGRWSESGEVTFEVDGGTFTGYGTFPRTSEVIVGTVRRTGPDSFEVAGAADYRQDWGECDSDGCYEWIVRGSLEFTGIGSVENQSIDFTWKGSDVSGDTCTFTGEATGTRR